MVRLPSKKKKKKKIPTYRPIFFLACYRKHSYFFFGLSLSTRNYYLLFYGTCQKVNSTYNILWLGCPILSVQSGHPSFTFLDVTELSRCLGNLEETNFFTVDEQTPFVVAAFHTTRTDHATQLEFIIN